jgi:hypothetical protein
LVEFWAGKPKDDAGIGAELTGPEGDRVSVAFGQGGTSLAKRTREHKNRVDAAHFGVDRDGARAGRGEIEKSASGGLRSGETNRRYSGLLHQLRSDFDSAMEQAENTGIDSAKLDGASDGFCREFGGTGMGWVAFHHDWATGRERGDSSSNDDERKPLDQHARGLTRRLQNRKPARVISRGRHGNTPMTRSDVVEVKSARERESAQITNKNTIKRSKK